MRTISGLFDTYQHATRAVRALGEAGIGTADVSLIANNAEALYPGDSSAVGKDTTAGAEVGALLGGTGGLLAGLGVHAIPGLGPVIAGGWLFATVIGAVAGAGLGAATGGLIGLLTEAGIPKSDAHVYAEGVRRGGALVTARVSEAQVETATAVLAAQGAVDPADRRRHYETEGWHAFDEAAPEPTADEVRDDRRQPLFPPVV